jgi:hypothetical protein
MAIPPELQQELGKLDGVPHAADIGKAMEGHAALAAAKAEGRGGTMDHLFNSLMLATDDPADGEKLARAYARSLSFFGLVEEDKVTVLDWQDIFSGAGKADAYATMAANLEKAFKTAEGGVLIITEPYQCPPDMSPRDFAFNNYSATALLMEKMDEVEDSFDKTFDDLYKKGKDLGEIERQMSGKDFENPRKPVVVVVGRPFEMDCMISEDPHPWNMRFANKIGISTGDIMGPQRKNPRKGFTA